MKFPTAVAIMVPMAYPRLPVSMPGFTMCVHPLAAAIAAAVAGPPTFALDEVSSAFCTHHTPRVALSEVAGRDVPCRYHSVPLSRGFTSIGSLAANPTARTIAMCTESWMQMNARIQRLPSNALRSPAPAGANA